MIIDHIDNLVLPDELTSSYRNEINQLQMLYVGLAHLFDQVRKIEKQVVDTMGSTVGCVWGGPPDGMSQRTMDRLTCAFHWYAVSACNYVQLAGWLVRSLPEDESFVRRYVEKVIPEVLVYRNKVAAHFAKADPHKKDNRADLQASTLPSVSWSKDDAFYAGSVKLSMTSGGCVETSSLERWSLTKTHAELRLRYWPDQPTS